MAPHSTFIKLRNGTDKRLVCKLTFGWRDGLLIDEQTVEPNAKVELNCEYVWYDLRILHNNNQVAFRGHVKGETTPQTWAVYQDDTDGHFHVDWDYGFRLVNTPHSESHPKFDWQKHQALVELAVKELGDPGDMYTMMSPAEDGLSYGA